VVARNLEHRFQLHESEGFHYELVDVSRRLIFAVFPSDYDYVSLVKLNKMAERLNVVLGGLETPFSSFI